MVVHGIRCCHHSRQNIGAICENRETLSGGQDHVLEHNTIDGTDGSGPFSPSLGNEQRNNRRPITR